jgi:Arc/MetJ family transcription regulator
MATNLGIDTKLLSEAQKIGRKRTKKDTVNEALLEYVRKRKKLEILEDFGTVDYYDDFDPKEGRKKR